MISLDGLTYDEKKQHNKVMKIFCTYSTKISLWRDHANMRYVLPLIDVDLYPNEWIKGIDKNKYDEQ
jgi:hypothetical protein